MGERREQARSPHRSNSIDYMELRLWIGLHSCLQCFILVISDASYIIKYITRFTEEGFSSLISFIFISDAIKKMVGSARQSSHIQTGSAISWPAGSKTCVLLGSQRNPQYCGGFFKEKKTDLFLTGWSTEILSNQPWIQTRLHHFLQV